MTLQISLSLEALTPMHECGPQPYHPTNCFSLNLWCQEHPSVKTSKLELQHAKLGGSPILVASSEWQDQYLPWDQAQVDGADNLQVCFDCMQL